MKRKCPLCGSEFDIINDRKIYCSDSCRIKAQNDRQKDRRIAAMAKNKNAARKSPKEAKPKEALQGMTGPFRMITEEWADHIRYWHEELGDSPEYLAKATGRDISVIKAVLRGDL